MTGDDCLCEYRIFRTRDGLFTAQHVPSGIFLHSRVDPVAEARESAAEYRYSGASELVLLGGGLGYLVEALAEFRGERDVFVIEPEAALFQMARFCRGRGAYFSSPRVHHIIASAPSVMAERLRGVAGSAALIVASYLERIAATQRSLLTGFLQSLRAERVSRVVYDELLTEHRRLNRERLNSLRRAVDVGLETDKSVVVAGAGPSLDECRLSLQRWRQDFTLVATSGAVPCLLASGIEPDWVVAMEAKDTILRDLHSLPEGTRVMVFECTHPQILRESRVRLFNGVGVETRGGTTLVPAVDFALQCASGNVIVVGADLGYGSRAYASGARRESAAETGTSVVAPKFLAMRAALESLLERNTRPGRIVYHVLSAGPVLRGARRAQPRELDAMLTRKAITKEMV